MAAWASRTWAFDSANARAALSPARVRRGSAPARTRPALRRFARAQRPPDASALKDSAASRHQPATPSLPSNRRLPGRGGLVRVGRPKRLRERWLPRRPTTSRYGAAYGVERASHQSGNPVGRLKCLIAVAFHVERRLDEMPAWFVPVHASCGRGDQCRALIVLVENHDKAVLRVAISLTKVVDPLDRLDQHATGSWKLEAHDTKSRCGR